MGAFTPYHGYNRLRCRVKGRGLFFLGLCRCRDSICLFGSFLKCCQCVAGQNVRYQYLCFQVGKDFITGFQQGQIGIVKLSAVQRLKIRAVQGIVIAGFGGLDKKGISIIQLIGGLLFLWLLFLLGLTLLLKL